jgi:thermitase
VNIIQKILIASLTLSLVACTSKQVQDVQADQAGYMTKISLSPGDTQESIEAKYGASVSVWEEGDAALQIEPYAILVASKLPAGLSSQNMGTWASTGTKAYFFAGQRAQMSGTKFWADGTKFWADGTKFWADGTKFWADGTKFWADGQYGPFPENTDTWKSIGLERAQELATNMGNGIKVAVIDTGVDLVHPLLKDKLAPASEWRDYVDNDRIPQEVGTLGVGGYGHGTNVAGIVLQVAPKARILPIRVLDRDGMGTVLSVVRAINYAVNKEAAVINLSLGAQIFVQEVEDAVQNATKRGVLVVMSAGNAGGFIVNYPAKNSCEYSCAAGVPRGDWYTWLSDRNRRISVGSVDLAGKPSTFTTRNLAGIHHVEIAAPGEYVVGPFPGLRAAAWSGTSQSAPIVSGLLALGLAESGRWKNDVTAENLTIKLEQAAVAVNHTNPTVLGQGRVRGDRFIESILR